MNPPPESTRESLLVVPALNEAGNLERLLAAVASTGLAADVLVVDDGSHDATAKIAQACGAIVVRHPFNLGYGAALQTGYKYADRNGYAFVVQMDADGQHDPADVARLLEPVRRGEADLVIGSRFIQASDYPMGVVRSAARRFFTTLLVALGGPRVADPTSGFQALSRPVFRFCCSDLYPSDFPDIDVLLLLHRQGFRIREVPVRMAPSPSERRTMHSGLRALYYPYKMLLSTLRFRLTPRVASLTD